MLAEAVRAPTPAPTLPTPVEVDIIRPDLPRPSFEAQPGASRPSVLQPQSSGQISTGTQNSPGRTEREKDWIRAETFLSASVLEDPRSRQARLALTTLVGADRREQICALEAMEQVRNDRTDFRPTRLAPHAFRNAQVRDGMILVTAGAMRSQQQWYEIAYRCQLDPAGQQVIGFEYALGAPVDRALWDAHGLAPIH